MTDSESFIRGFIIARALSSAQNAAEQYGDDEAKYMAVVMRDLDVTGAELALIVIANQRLMKQSEDVLRKAGEEL